MRVEDTKFKIGDFVYGALDGRKGIINTIVFESNDFYFYTVVWENNEIDRAKEIELLNKEDYDIRRIMDND